MSTRVERKCAHLFKWRDDFFYHFLRALTTTYLFASLSLSDTIFAPAVFTTQEQQDGGVDAQERAYPAHEEVAAARLIVGTLSRRLQDPTANTAVEGAAMLPAKTRKSLPASGGGGGSSTSSNGHGSSSATLTCESPLCNKNPSFGYRGETRRRFCKRHAEPGMLNVYYKYCDARVAGAGGGQGRQCAERASFEGEGKLRCLEHREPGMRPRNNICQLEGGGCTRQSSYGIEGGKPVLCTLHREAGMVQVRRGSAVTAGSLGETSWFLFLVVVT